MKGVNEAESNGKGGKELNVSLVSLNRTMSVVLMWFMYFI